MERDQAPRRDDPADPVTSSPEEVARAGAPNAAHDPDAAGGPDAADPNRKADTTKAASVEPPD